jgi:two-component system phosphate regulon sensor histidine kinase PhoR
VTLEAFAFFALMAVALATVVGMTITRMRLLEDLRDALGVGQHGDLSGAVRSLRDRLADSEHATRRLAEDQQVLIDQLDSGVIRLDDRHRVQVANRAAGRLLGARQADLIGRSAMEVFVDHRIEETMRAAQERGPASIETVIGSRTIVVRARRAPTGGSWATLEDVSELRRLQRIRTEFIDNLSHELRTPLTTIRLLTEALANDLQSADVAPRIRERILTIDVETGHLVQMVNELLDLSRIESGARESHLDQVDMPDVIRSAVERLGPFAERQGVALSADPKVGRDYGCGATTSDCTSCSSTCSTTR